MGRMIRRGVFLMAVMPMVAAGARRLSQAMETRRGPSRMTGMLRRSADMMQRPYQRVMRPVK